MRTVHRYEVPVDDHPHTFDLTGNPHKVAATLRSSWLQQHVVEFWVEHDAQAPVARRTFQAFGTGHPLPDGARLIGTADRLGGLVWHLYELPAGEEK